MCSTLGQGPGLTHKHYTRLERPAGDKNEENKIYNIEIWSNDIKNLHL